MRDWGIRTSLYERLGPLAAVYVKEGVMSSSLCERGGGNGGGAKTLITNLTKGKLTGFASLRR